MNQIANYPIEFEEGLETLSVMELLKFSPILKRAIWGGQQLEQVLNKAGSGQTDIAESWELSDVPDNASLVSHGSLAGISLRDLMIRQPQALLGRHASVTRFPLLVKFLDANRQLSVQVHPADSLDGKTGEIVSGKAEAWIVLASSPDSCMYLGLQPGITAAKLRTAIEENCFEQCLHRYHPQVGDCIYLAPGTVHALGGGLLIAEIQQTCDTTYRLHDWGRLDAQGRPRELHLEAGLAVTDYSAGPVLPVTPRPLPGGGEELVVCPYFVIHRHTGPAVFELPHDERMHILVVLAGQVRAGGIELVKGETLLLPAARESTRVECSEDAILLDSFLPDAFGAGDTGRC
ncbi:type I phosphomannose isomerase catalytic subunit [Planctomicrobium sp. SH664]|uniref:type I phosphomannose isomerase catalytic subunit n=1 Tax=Planctomicrobium sp. SH664 TaxID=3448125 RepID=UPI003F5B7B2F